ncbi:MAG: phosphoglycerate mutase [Actinomycetes bacterium]
MKPPGYGEDQPRFSDDRLPVILITLDGLGDRPAPELSGASANIGMAPGPMLAAGLTPSEAASTPVLDGLTERGACGWHLPFGWGVAPSSEVAHWSMFGYEDIAFPGRAVLEALGAGIDVAAHQAVTFAALRTSRTQVAPHGQTVWITGRVARSDSADSNDAAALWSELEPVFAQHAVGVHHLGRGEAILTFTEHARGDITDSDPFFEDFHPWLRVRPTSPDGEYLAAELNAMLISARKLLMRSEINASRRAAGKPAFDVVTTKWSGSREELPSFEELTGVAGAAITSSRLYQGLATLLGMTSIHHGFEGDLVANAGTDIAARLRLAEGLIDAGAPFVHVHTKATDEAGHTKRPRFKADVIESIDSGLVGLDDLARRAIIAITGDHATPSTHGVIHTADPTPLLIVGPTVRPDRVTKFGEAPYRDGWYGNVAARQLLPLLFGHANRPVFLGHRATPRQTLALPDNPEPMTFNDVDPPSTASL